MQIAFNPTRNNYTFKSCTTKTSVKITSEEKRPEEISINMLNDLLPELEKLEEAKESRDIQVRHARRGSFNEEEWDVTLPDKYIYISRSSNGFYHVKIREGTQIKHLPVKDKKESKDVNTTKTIDKEHNIWHHKDGSDPKEELQAIGKIITELNKLKRIKDNLSDNECSESRANYNKASHNINS